METTMAKYENEAKVFCDAIRKFNQNENALENLLFYLENHFGKWLEKWANTPESMAGDMKYFAELFD